MKRLILIFLFALIIFPLISFAQYSWQWAIAEGAAYNDYITSIDCDDEGNVYAVGVFEGTVDFFGETLISTGGNDVFIASFNAQGNLIWVRQGGGTYEDFPRDIYTDNQYIYVTGGFGEQAIFDDETLISTGVRDMFLLKYDLEGNLQWATSGGSVTDDAGNSVTADDEGNIYIVGDMNYTATFGNHSVTYYGFTDIFIAQYDANGICQWATSAGGPIYDYGSSIAVVNNNLFIGGSFNDVAVFGTSSVTSVDLVDIFIAHYLTDGTFVEVVSAGGMNNENLQCMAVDSNLNVYISGWFMLDITIGDNTFNSNGVYDIFLAKYEPGVGFNWAQSFGGVGSDEALDMYCDVGDNLIFTGIFENTVTLGSTQLVSDGFDDGFMGKFDHNGTFDWVYQAGGSGGIRVNACTADNDDNYYFAGDFVEELIIGNFVFNPVGAYDLFMAKLGEGSDINENGILSPHHIVIFPNPANEIPNIKYTLSVGSHVNLSIYDELGKHVNTLVDCKQIPGEYTIQLEKSDLRAGNYLIKLLAGNYVETAKMIVLR